QARSRQDEEGGGRRSAPRDAGRRRDIRPRSPLRGGAREGGAADRGGGGEGTQCRRTRPGRGGHVDRSSGARSRSRSRRRERRRGGARGGEGGALADRAPEKAVRLPRGFLASGVRAGIRKKRPDVALIVAPGGATAAAIFTRTRFQAAPVVLSRSGLKRS